MSDFDRDRRSNNKVLPAAAAGVALIGGLVGYALFEHKQEPPAAPEKPRGDAPVLAVSSTNAALPLPSGVDASNATVQALRLSALGLFAAMDKTNHPCNPLDSSKARISKVDNRELTSGNSLYTMWITDGTRTCGLDMLHSSGRSENLLPGDFLQRFYLDSFQNGFNYSVNALNSVIEGEHKRFRKADISEAAREMMVNAIGAEFFINTFSGPDGNFQISEGVNAISNGGAKYTTNIVRASLRRTDMGRASLTDHALQNKVDLFIEAAPAGDRNAFTVVYVDVYNNGFKAENYGKTAPGGGNNVFGNWLDQRR